MLRQVSDKNLVFPLFITLISALLLSCSGKKKSEPSTLHFDQIKLPATERDISEYIEDMYVIPMETHPEALLGRVGLIEQDESGIFIVSGQKETVYHFSREGNYLNSFSHNGKGPGEYLNIRNMRIVPKTQTLLGTDSLSSPGNYFGFPIRFFRDSYDDHFLYVMEAMEIHELIASYTEEQKRILAKKIRGFKQLLNIGIDDNPVLVYVRFKN